MFRPLFSSSLSLRVASRTLSSPSSKPITPNRKISTHAEIVDACNEHSLWTWSAQKAVSPVSMVKAEGIYFWDGDGKRYLDLNSQLMCSNIGHGHPKVIKAIQDQAEELAFAGPPLATKVRARFGAQLAKHTPPHLNKFFFTLGGADANENAVKFAKTITGRHKIVARHRAYHGATLGAMSLTGDPRRWAVEPNPMAGVVRIFDPYKYRSHLYREGDSDEEFTQRLLDQIEETLMFENPESVAAVLMEPVTGTNGLIVPPKDYLPGVRKLCDKYGILLICDEVMSGVGRTGEWFAVDHWGVEPDLLVMAKGLTSAYLPLGCVALAEKHAAHFDHKPLPGGLTYSGHPMCLAAAEATLQVMEEENIVENASKMGKVMAKHLLEMKERHPSVGDVRSIGLFGGIELVKNRKTKESLVPYGKTHPKMVELNAFLRNEGLYAFSSQSVVFTIPPLVINEEQLKDVFEIMDRALNITDEAYEEN